MTMEETKTIHIDDAKLFLVSEDAENAFKCNTTGLSLIGCREIELTYIIQKNENQDKIECIKFKIEHAKLSKEDFEILTLWNGSFQLKLQILDKCKDGGDIHACIFNAKCEKVNVVECQNNCYSIQLHGIGTYTQHKFDGSPRLIDLQINALPQELKATEDSTDHCGDKV